LWSPLLSYEQAKKGSLLNKNGGVPTHHSLKHIVALSTNHSLQLVN
jgi:hypothetical protein